MQGNVLLSTHKASKDATVERVSHNGSCQRREQGAMAADVGASWRALAGLSVSWGRRVSGTDLGSDGSLWLFWCKESGGGRA